MKSLLGLLVLLSACRCGDRAEVVVQVPQVNEAGPTVELPEAVKPVIPRLDRLVEDQASVERSVIQLKNLGLGRLVDAG